MQSNQEFVKDIIDIVNNTTKMKPTQPTNNKTYDDFLIEEFIFYYNRLSRSDREGLMDLVRTYCTEKPIF